MERRVLRIPVKCAVESNVLKFLSGDFEHSRSPAGIAPADEFNVRVGLSHGASEGKRASGCGLAVVSFGIVGCLVADLPELEVERLGCTVLAPFFAVGVVAVIDPCSRLLRTGRTDAATERSCPALPSFRFEIPSLFAL